MVIRLLQKRDIDVAKAKDRALEVGEGKKLAQRVDDLRQLSSAEEKNLRNFRDNTVKTVMEEIKSFVAQKETLREELAELGEERKRLKEPLDAEWHKLAQDKAFLEERKEKLYEKEGNLSVSLNSLENMERELENEKNRIQDERERSENYLASSYKAHDEAREVLAEANNTAEVMFSKAELKVKDAINREQAVSVREDEVNTQIAHIEKEKIGILNRERVLVDRYATLERTLKRHD